MSSFNRLSCCACFRRRRSRSGALSLTFMADATSEAGLVTGTAYGV
jgi:hypothetical protein